MADIFHNSKWAIDLLAVVKDLIDTKVEVSSFGEFWALASAKMRTEHGHEVSVHGAQTTYRKMHVADPSLPDARKFLARARRSAKRKNNRAAGENADGMGGDDVEEGEEEEERVEDEETNEVALPIRER